LEVEALERELRLKLSLCLIAVAMACVASGAFIVWRKSRSKPGAGG
jgi:hypothetical protein